MALLPLEARIARLLATLVAWALFVGAWLVLGALGRATSALWFAGLVPVALWMAVAGVADALAGPRGPSRRVVALALALTAAALAAAALRGGEAVFIAAAGWGVLSCAAARRLVAMGGLAPGCSLAPGVLAGPAAWPAFGARWAMLPMMAGLAVQSDWCAGPGLSAAQGTALHLAAMLLPLTLLRGARAPRLPQAPVWIVTFMAAGVLALALVPSVRGWMAMSLLQAVAWAIAWSQASAAPRASPQRRGARLGLGIAPAAALLALGAVMDAFGLEGLIAVHVGLAAVSLAAALAASLAVAGHPAPTGQQEKLS